MHYRSTRGDAPVLGFDDVLMTGLAADGGLYLPERWPHFSPAELRALAGRPYAELAAAIMLPFMAGSAAESALEDLTASAYARFAHAAVLPLKQLGPNHWLMEQFHGPTLAFKDVAMQMLGELFDVVLAAHDRRLTIIGATSGDTGSAAIEAVKDKARLSIFMLHPKGRVSEVQRRQMTTVSAANVHNLAIEGSFDDCQDLVKAMFNDRAFRERHALTAVNSINWARIMAQIVYYFWAALLLGAPDRRIAFSVPTGNFGNVYAAYAARAMGLPVERLIVGSNKNDILTRFFETGAMTIEAVSPSHSPSMDIQISSNFERLLFDLLEGDGAAVAKIMTDFRKEGVFRLEGAAWQKATALFAGHRLSDEETLAQIKATFAASGELVDPHSAVGIAAAEAKGADLACPVVTLATAHPAKFPDAVEQASGIRPALPERIADLYALPERASELPAELDEVEQFISKTLAGETITA